MSEDGLHELQVGDIVWASAKRSIFWPAQIIEADANGRSFTVHFYGEDTVETIKNPNKILPYCHASHEQFISIGRKQHNIDKRLQFNKGLAAADKEMTETCKVEEQTVSLRRSPRKRGNPEPADGSTEYRKTARIEKHKTKEQTKGSKIGQSVDQNTELSSSKIYTPLRGRKVKRNKKVKLSEQNTETGPESKGANCKEDVISSLQFIADTKVAQVSSCQCACLNEKTANTKRKNKKNSPHKDKEVKSRGNRENGDCVEGTKLGQSHSCKNKGDQDMAKKNKELDKELIAGAAAVSPPKSESSSDDDDDLPEAFSLSQEPCSPGAFALHDVVWAKYKRDPFWPAQILKISRKKKKKKYYVKFLCDPCNHLIHVQEKKLQLFSCNQRQTFLEAITDQRNFIEAVTMAEDLVNRKGLGKSFEVEHEEDDNELEENTSDEDEPEETEDIDKEDTDTRPEAPVLIRRSSRERIQVSRYSDIVTYVREARPSLKSIYEGKKVSWRHNTYFNGSKKQQEKLKLAAGFGPIGNADLQEQIMELLLSFHQEVTKEKQYSAVKYVSDVWLPEAIIFAIQRKDLVDRETAEEMYLTGSSEAVSSADIEKFTQNLKQKTLTDEDREACRRRAERALAREIGAVS